MLLRPFTLLGLVVSMATGLVLGVGAFVLLLERGYLRGPSEVASLPAIVRHVRDSYVEPIPEETLVENAIRGIVSGLDNHSTFLDNGEFDDLKEETTGKFGGIGVEVGLVEGWFTVIAPIDGTPAARAGMQAGDVIVEVDGASLRGRRLGEAVSDLRGAPGTPVALRVRREGVASALEFDLVRETIRVVSVRSRLIEPGYGYLRISQFQHATPEHVLEAVGRLEEETGAALEGLVLDLRNNPGGVLGASVDVADTFLERGLIVYTEGRDASSEVRFSASGTDVLNGAPLAVLINRGSASASEIVAGALQDHGRAVVVGTRSYGKGSVQSVLPLTNERAIKLTTARYFTPKGRSIHDSGIEPDVDVPRDRTETRAAYDELLLAEAMRQLKRG